MDCVELRKGSELRIPTGAIWPHLYTLGEASGGGVPPWGSLSAAPAPVRVEGQRWIPMLQCLTDLINHGYY